MSRKRAGGDCHAGCVVLLAHPARRQEALADRDHHLWAAPSWPAYEIVAVDTSQGLWAYADSGPVGFSEGASVLPDAPPSTVTAQSAWAGPPARTHLFGVLGADVASVEVIFHHRGRRERVVRRPTTAFVGSCIRQSRSAPTQSPFAGCVPPTGVRVVAFNAQGLRVGSAHPASLLAHPCNPKTWFRRR